MIQTKVVSNGDNSRYHFIIEFFLPVDKYGCEYEVRERDVRFSLRKKEADWWPRLLYENIKVRNLISQIAVFGPFEHLGNLVV